MASQSGGSTVRVDYPRRTYLQRALWAVVFMSGTTGVAERAAGWLSGSTIDELAGAAETVEKMIDSIPVLGTSEVQDGLAIGAIIAAVIAACMLVYGWRSQPRAAVAASTPVAPPVVQPLPQPAPAAPAPRLEIVFKRSSHLGVNDSGTTARVLVFNRGTADARNVVLKIEDLARVGKGAVGGSRSSQFSSMRLERTRDHGQPIRPGDFAEYLVLTATTEGPALFFYIGKDDETRTENDAGVRFPDVGDHDLTVMAIADGAPPARKEFTIRFKDDAFYFREKRGKRRTGSSESRETENPAG